MRLAVWAQMNRKYIPGPGSCRCPGIWEKKKALLEGPRDRALRQRETTKTTQRSRWKGSMSTDPYYSMMHGNLLCWENSPVKGSRASKSGDRTVGWGEDKGGGERN